MFEVLERMCHRLETGGDVCEMDFKRILEFLDIFAYRCHRAKEEELLFPALLEAGIPENGPITTIINEHKLGKNYTIVMNEALARRRRGDISWSRELLRSAREHVLMLRFHIQKEDDLIFSMADQILSAEKEEELLKRFEEMDTSLVGAAQHEEFYNSIRQLRQMYME